MKNITTKKFISIIGILLIIFVVYTILLISIMQNKNITTIAKNEDISKAMPESTEITDLQKQIERLQKENEDLAAEISKATAAGDKVLSGEKVWTNGNIEEGTMTNNGTISQTINPGEEYIIPAGYTAGGKVTANPNQNSGTYTYAANSTGGTIDLGVNNNIRYINAANVYNKGKTDGQSTPSLTTQSRSYSFTVDVGERWQSGNGTVTFSFPHGVVGVYDTFDDTWCAVAVVGVSGNTVTLKGMGISGRTSSTTIYAYGY